MRGNLGSNKFFDTKNNSSSRQTNFDTEKYLEKFPNKNTRLGKAEELRIAATDPESKERWRLVEHNILFGISMVNKVWARYSAANDYASLIGVMEDVFIEYSKTFLDRNAKFTTYCSITLHRELVRDVVRQSTVASSVPEKFFTEKPKALKDVTSFVDIPADAKIFSGIKSQGHSDIAKVFLDRTSDTNSPEKELFQKELKKHVEQFLLTLTDRERQILSDRYELDNKKKRTLVEIGKDFGITRERVRQIEASLEKRMKKYFMRKGYSRIELQDT